MGRAIHEPVLVAEVVRLMEGAETVLDVTVGPGGHAEALLAAGTRVVVGVDRDPEAVRAATERLAGYGDRFRPHVARFSEADGVLRAEGIDRVGGVLYDLGVSSLQLDREERGFSYRRSGPLDMRMGEEGPTAAHLVATASEEELARILRERGEERFARRIAGAIVRARERQPIETTDRLAAVVAGAVPRRRGGPHPARRTFQALRIEVNRELEELEASLPRVTELLAPGARITVIAYHSLEDRIVKRFLAGDPRLRVLTPKPVRASGAERDRNPRSRSAKLRAAERAGDQG